MQQYLVKGEAARHGGHVAHGRRATRDQDVLQVRKLQARKRELEDDVGLPEMQQHYDERHKVAERRRKAHAEHSPAEHQHVQKVAHYVEHRHGHDRDDDPHRIAVEAHERVELEQQDGRRERERQADQVIANQRLKVCGRPARAEERRNVMGEQQHARHEHRRYDERGDHAHRKDVAGPRDVALAQVQGAQHLRALGHQPAERGDEACDGGSQAVSRHAFGAQEPADDDAVDDDAEHRHDNGRRHADEAALEHPVYEGIALLQIVAPISFPAEWAEGKKPSIQSNRLSINAYRRRSNMSRISSPLSQPSSQTYRDKQHNKRAH